MERIIKFRAWAVASRKMFYPDINDGWEIFDGTINPLPNTHLMQFTGLQDKNGVDCYEKDYDEDGNMIDWCERCVGYQFFIIDIPSKDVIACHNCEGNFMLQDHIQDFEIIGNIYENH